MAVTSDKQRGKSGHAEIGRGGDGARQLVAGHHADQQRAQPGRKQQARAAAEERQYHALGQRLAHETCASRAKRQPNRDLLLPARRPRQQQVGDVRARDEEHQAHHRHQDVERRRHLSAHIGQSPASGIQIELLDPKAILELPRRCGESGHGVQLVFVDLPVDDVELWLRGVGRESRLQAANDVQPPALTIVEIVYRRRHLGLHHDRHEQIGRRCGDDAGEADGRDADDCHRRAVDRHHLVQDGRVAGEAPLPEPMAQYRHRVRARRPIVIVGEPAAERRLHAQDGKRVARDELRLDALGLATIGERRRRRRARHQAAEGVVAIAKIPIHRMREGTLVRRPAAEGAGAVELHQLARILDRQQPQQHLIHQREDGGVGADPQRQRQHDDDREGGRAGQRADGVAEILDQRRHVGCPC